MAVSTEVKLPLSKYAIDILYDSYKAYKDSGKPEGPISANSNISAMRAGLKGFAKAAEHGLGLMLAQGELKGQGLIEKDNDSDALYLTGSGIWLANALQETWDTDWE